MKRLSTRSPQRCGSIRKNNLSEVGGNPRKKTLDFLTQLARVYKVEPALGSELGSYVLN
ncbi:hypothetical protein M2133_002064 [Parabacteroides sp. PF5-6]|nr:hypothetical protein [Parabacteroides sp. PF5-6]